jgi:hypothetical protein
MANLSLITSRFMSMVDVIDDADSCWNWKGFITPSGHGQFWMPSPLVTRCARHSGRDIRASRAAWILAHGPIETTDYICHTCNNPRCVRLSHLYKGTHQTNQADKIGQYRNEQATHVKLNWTKVRYIRASEGHESRASLAAFYEVSPTTIGRIWRGVDKGGWREEVPLNG